MGAIQAEARTKKYRTASACPQAHEARPVSNMGGHHVDTRPSLQYTARGSIRARRTFGTYCYGATSHAIPSYLVRSWLLEPLEYGNLFTGRSQRGGCFSESGGN